MYEMSRSRASWSGNDNFCVHLTIPLLLEEADRQDVHMAIYRLLRREVFEPEDVRLLATVYEDVLNTVGLVDRKSPLAEQIAKRVVQVAQAGERDPESLKDLALEAVQQSRKTASSP
jgi:hypothetical protein